MSTEVVSFSRSDPPKIPALFLECFNFRTTFYSTLENCFTCKNFLHIKIFSTREIFARNFFFFNKELLQIESWVERQTQIFLSLFLGSASSSCAGVVRAFLILLRTISLMERYFLTIYLKTNCSLLRKSCDYNLVYRKQYFWTAKGTFFVNKMFYPPAVTMLGRTDHREG